MSNIIEIDLDNRGEYVNEYDDHRINDRMHQYILENPIDVRKDIVLNIKFNYKVKEEELDTFKDMLRVSFANELTKIESELKKINYRDFFLILLGILFLVIYSYFERNDIFLFAEFFLIIGWVAIWEFAESLLFYRRRLARNRIIYKKLLLAKIEVNE